MSYKCNYNERCGYIKKGLRKGRTVSSEKYRQNCAGGDYKNVKSDGS